jgi:hypothetical protein
MVHVQPRTQNPKDKLLALKIINEANESVFSLFGQGPQVLHIKAINEKIDRIEESKSGYEGTR